jgi:hypothetical protein
MTKCLVVVYKKIIALFFKRINIIPWIGIFSSALRTAGVQYKEALIKKTGFQFLNPPYGKKVGLEHWRKDF